MENKSFLSTMGVIGNACIYPGFAAPAAMNEECELTLMR